MDDVALAPYNRPESAFNFQSYQETPDLGLRLLLLYCRRQATAASSTDSSPKAVIYSVPLQFQPQHYTGKAPAGSQGPSPSNAEFQSLRAQLQHLQQAKQAALAQVQKLQTQ